MKCNPEKKSLTGYQHYKKDYEKLANYFLGCILFAFLGTGSGLSAIWTITAISFERCQAISAPLNSSRQFTNKKVCGFY